MSKLATLILATVSKGAAKAAIYGEAFSQDAMFLVTANNDQNLTDAVKALPASKASGAITSPQFAALGDAIGKACKALRDSLPDGAGWIGARSGAFSKATKEDRAPYLAAHALACEVFAATLSDSVHWRDLTEQEREAQKVAREAKKEEKKADKAAQDAAQAEAVRVALVQSGEYVHRDSLPLTLGAASPAELVGALITLHDSGATIPLDQLRALVAALEAGAKVPA